MNQATHYTHCKIVIETQSPLAINTGKRETGFDTELARDVNGLPLIPATAIAGVWSHLTLNTLGEQQHHQWFGSTQAASRVTISNAKLLNSKNQAVSNFILPDHIASDPILALASKNRPHHRERVALNDRGVAKEHAKFDQILLPTGMRFSLSLSFYHNNAEDDLAQWMALLALWGNRRMSFGSSTRNGLGRISVISTQQKTFSLADGAHIADEILDYRNTSVVNDRTLQAHMTNTTNSGFSASLPIKAMDNWRCGSGADLLGSHSDAELANQISIISYSEPRVTWNDNQATIANNQAVLCGSSIKGVLAHRLGFHYRRLTSQWAEQAEEWSDEQWHTRPDEVKHILGVHDTEDNANNLAGKLFVDDSIISYTHTVIRHHNSIDRFTGGVKQGALFTEELLYQPKFTLNLHISDEAAISPTLKKALLATINDIELGLLPIGAGSGRGNSLVQKDPVNSQHWIHNFDQIPTHQAEEIA